VTGRLSGEGGIQQVPRDPFIRSIIGSRPGWKFVSADYSQIELRIAAMVSEDKKLLAQYQRGEDVHMLRAMKMTGKPAKRVEKEERKKAKAVNFGYVYGMGENKFITYAFENYDVRVTPEEAHTDREGFFEDYPALRVWHERQRRLARRYRMVRSPLGRIRHLPDIGSSTESVRQEAERQAINSPVQATASDLMLMSLVELHRLLDPKHGFVVGTVHDSILFEIRDEYVDEYAEIIKTTMEDVDRVRRMYECEITVPIVADIEVGTHWGEGKEWAS
jgi:DNA polymerase I-like protein with 3'-5' exonuclease and polymerase domains